MFTIISALLPAAVAPAPLQPNENWTVAYEESMCLASRSFGANADVKLLLRPSPFGDNVEVTFIQSGSPDRRVVRDGKAALLVSPAGGKFDGSYKAWRSPSQKGRVVIVYTQAPVLNALTDDSVLTLSAPREKPVSVSMRHLTKLKPVIEDCKRTVAKHWGVDLNALDRIAVPAEPAADPASWVRYTDYPDDALRKGQGGVVTLLWSIGASGDVKECKVVASSGVASLDRAGCRAIMSRARYQPAKDGSGQAVPAYGMRRIMWLTSGG